MVVGGLGTRMPVLGLTMGITFLVRVVAGWLSLFGGDVFSIEAETKGGAVEESEIDGVTCCCGWIWC
jgi:hypothetical protein